MSSGAELLGDPASVQQDFRGTGLLAGMDALNFGWAGTLPVVIAFQKDSATEGAVRGFGVSVLEARTVLRVVGVCVLVPRDEDGLNPVLWSYDRVQGVETALWSFRRGGRRYELSVFRPADGGPWSARYAVLMAPGEFVPGPGSIVEVFQLGQVTPSLRRVQGGAVADDWALVQIRSAQGFATAREGFEAMLVDLPGSDAFAAAGRYPDSRLPDREDPPHG